MSVIPEPPQASEPVPDASADGVDPSQASEPGPDASADGEGPARASEPVPDGSAGGEDLLGLRIGAALIDLALLLVLFVVLAVVVGEAIVNRVGVAFSFTLDGAGFAVYVALALLYYLVLEAAIGQTVGKLLVGLRVVRAGGGRPNVLHVAARTLVRVVDWLPAFYLVGFIAMLATGARRRRLGDLAADTRIARAVPMRHRGLATAGLASSLVLVLAGSVVYAASDQDEGAQTYRGNGVSFDYPAGWEEGIIEGRAVTGSGDELWEVAFVLDGASFVSFTAYGMNMPVTAEDLDAVKAESEEVVQELFEQDGGTVQSGPEEITAAGKPGLRFQATGTLDGTSFESTIVFIFDDTTEYYLNCQYTAEWAEEIERGCEQIVRTFTVDMVETESTVPPAAETPAPTQAKETAAPGAGAVDVFDLEVGDCLADSLTGGVEGIFTVETVPCSQPHSEEIYAVVPLPEGDFPGDEAVAVQADEGCTAEFESFVGLPYEESVLYYNYLYPSDEQSWNGGYRWATCSVYDPAGEVRGSLRGVQR
jgi:uncharacterized RDD family membrane protein YckC